MPDSQSSGKTVIASAREGRVFDFKRFAVHDGPGIRTTVFLKGCPLSCAWCHNPEAIIRGPQIFFRPERCIECLACVDVCPTSAQTVVDNKRVFTRGVCDLSGFCVDVCNSGALELAGRVMSVDEVMEAVRADAGFYDESGGGVTLSGGEPLLQAEFAIALLRACHTAGIHTAVDTCGQLQWSTLEAALPFTEMFLYDLKDMSSENHRANTGVLNDRIIDNLKRLSGTGVPIEIRIVIIPGVNDSDDQIEGAGRFIGGLDNITGVRLLAYHRMAGSKYDALDMKNTLPDVEPPDELRLMAIGKQLEAQGLTVHLPERA
ncbi:MAG TPA: glycyl-radical enzyme activating protein [Dehalococcoidia bacterium]|jgi:pyruvate formate lyase activating enzyme|nr:glycyl-radical enzyme activating protein [Chloroflexota bacterium]MDP5877756.1 glycyl-radical enzyme activating protein [Dehalococcoidia bacterium]MDP6272625.1 glycyl-radical enzyme activating protein [Dehalococcoidia bacterium]HCV28582.1 glycyl-radical enzyme activating protein [Dehalococcoidia bacterium]HJM54062.1 glycyl-radical enzyme activating protein [Dehalococcoidia bacterium]|tara:strand:+ start:309 stop:1262 length:954 start_codon:yes stop_codon:yes gene_type:complete